MHKSGSDGKFTSSIGFVLAAVGSAVGMANIWLFPYRVGQYGGGAFLIPYFLFVALFSYVGLSGEFALGRLTGTGAMGSLDYVLRQRGRRGGRVLGAIPLLGVLGIAIGYSVVVGWVLRYAAGSLTGSVLAGDAQGFFSALAVDFGSIPWHFAAVAVTAAILIFGVASGIEKLSKVMMPAFFILFLIIIVMTWAQRQIMKDRKMSRRRKAEYDAMKAEARAPAPAGGLWRGRPAAAAPRAPPPRAPPAAGGGAEAEPRVPAAARELAVEPIGLDRPCRALRAG